MKSMVVLCVAGLLLLSITPLFGADWPQFRGPTRNGIAPDSPPLLEEFPKDGLKKIWESEEIPIPGITPNTRDYGSVVVANGKAFLFVHSILSPQSRKMWKSFYKDEGYSSDMPPELSALVEKARVSEARLKLKDRKEIKDWADEWAKANLKEEQAAWRDTVLARLTRGSVLSWDALAKLAENFDREWKTEEEAFDWMRKVGIDEPSQKYIQTCGWWKWQLERGHAIVREYPAQDFIYCFDARNGKLLWKTAPMKGVPQIVNAHTTPAILGNRCYVYNSADTHYCFDVETGKELWQSEPFGFYTIIPDACCSELLVDGVAIGLSKTIAGVDIETGKTLWSRKDIGRDAGHSSAVTWRDGQKNWAILHIYNDLNCLDPKDGTTRWRWQEKGFIGFYGTPAILGDYMLLTTGVNSKSQDLMAFKLTPEKPEKLWQVPLRDMYTCPLIDHGYVYFIAGGAKGEFPLDSKVCCIKLESGEILWEEKKALSRANWSSPLLADGKIIAINHDRLTVFRATPEKFSLIGEVGINPLYNWTSPAFADGRVYLRQGRTRIVCYDLRKPQP